MRPEIIETGSPFEKVPLPGVGFEYCGIDFNLMSDEDILKFGAQIAEDNVILIRGQNLSEARLLHIFETIGRVLKPNQFFIHPEYPGLYRVTNRRENGEKIGIFADKELDWHSNGNGRPSNKECCVALYCLEPGIDSVTSFCDTRRAYNELPSDIKIIAEDIDCVFQFKNNTFYNLDPDDRELNMFQDNSMFPNGLVKPLVYTHPFDFQKGLYFTFHYIRKMWRRSGEFLNQQELMNFLTGHVFQEKYVYHHSDWKAGDLIFMDQFHSIHKRNAVKGERFLYRATLDYRHSWRWRSGRN